MVNSKVIITKQNSIFYKYSFENEVGLSSYDLALISTNQITNNGKININDLSETTYLI